MSEAKQVGRRQPLGQLGPEMLALLHTVPLLQSLAPDHLHCLDGSQLLSLDTADVLFNEGEDLRYFWILLEGSLKATKTDLAYRELPVHVVTPGFSFGEVPLMTNMPDGVTLIAQEPCRLLELDEDQFWRLMTECPEVRRGIIADLAQRINKMQSFNTHQEKMASLGTLAAGLMHELNNPGAAAQRAASQLRENLARMHKLGATLSQVHLTSEQKECMFGLQTRALATAQPRRMNTLEESDQEERLATWLEEANVEDDWRLAPTFVAIGIDEHQLQCAREEFPKEIFSDALSWLEAMVSSQQLTVTIEESIGRVADLVKAVKSYAYEGRSQKQTVDINDSIHATVVMLAHKMREKQIVLEKEFAANLPPLHTQCSGLNQIWTNLLDNAIDAVVPQGHIAIKTWSESFTGSDGNDRVDLCVSVRDDGAGIPLESQPQIFDPFYTTKPVGVGTGLGLGIVYRIVEQFGGVIRFSSQPGYTEFVVKLPAEPRTT